MHAAFFAAFTAIVGASPDAPLPNAKPTLSGPHTHANLTLYLIHGPDTMPGRRFMTLKDALEKKFVVVNETSNVNILSIDNTSPDVEVFVMAGDVVKGGKQDRAIAFDQIIPPKSGTLALPSFCVEAGRWRQRGAEDEKAFACSKSQIVGKAMRIAVNEARTQGQVWEEVANAQKKLSDNLSKPVANPASPSSLQLALEDKDLDDKLTLYEKSLADIPNGQKEVIGVVVIVNGEVTGADAFCNSDLFKNLWPKLLRAACTEALAEFKVEKKFEAMKQVDVEKFLSEAGQGESQEVAMPSTKDQPTQQHVATTDNAANQVQSVTNQSTGNHATPPKEHARVRIFRYAAAKSLLFECREKSNPANVVHRSFIAK